MSTFERGHAPDGCYFVNAVRDHDGFLASGILYYSNIPDGGLSAGQLPDDEATLTNGTFTTFEGDGAVGAFQRNPGVSFSWSIDQNNPTTAPPNTFVGHASNSLGSNWNIYKDDGKTIPGFPGFTYSSVYWCF